jgi:hypothetical protein
MMKWVLLGMAATTVALLAFGCYAEATGRSADENAGSAIFYLGGAALGVLTAGAALTYVVVRAS